MNLNFGTSKPAGQAILDKGQGLLDKMKVSVGMKEMMTSHAVPAACPFAKWF